MSLSEANCVYHGDETASYVTVDYQKETNKDSQSLWKPLKSTHPQIKKYFRFSKGDKIGWGKGVARIHASQEMVLAWLWHYDSNFRMRFHRRKGGNLSRAMTEYDSSQPRSSKILVEKKMPTGVKNR